MTYRDLSGQGTAFLSDCLLPLSLSLSLSATAVFFSCPETLKDVTNAGPLNFRFFHLGNSFLPSYHLDLKSHISETFSDQLREKSHSFHIQLLSYCAFKLFIVHSHSWYYAVYGFSYIFIVYFLEGKLHESRYLVLETEQCPAPTDVRLLIFRNCTYIPLSGRRDQDVIKLRTMRWKAFCGLCRWTQYNHEDPSKRRQESQSQWKV